MADNEYKPSRQDAREEELIDVLTAISIVSGRLAGKLELLTENRQAMKGENEFGKHEEFGLSYRRPACCRCCDH